MCNIFCCLRDKGRPRLLLIWAALTWGHLFVRLCVILGKLVPTLLDEKGCGVLLSTAVVPKRLLRLILYRNNVHGNSPEGHCFEIVMFYEK